MRYLIIALTGLLFFGCKRQSYQNQDIHYMAGTWKIVKVVSASDEKTSLYDDWGTFTINEDGTGTLEASSVDYTPTGEKLKCIFMVETLVGIDYSIDLYGLKKLDAKGKSTDYLCDEGGLHIRIQKQKKKKMTMLLDQTVANLYPCVITGYQLNKGNLEWIMEKQ